MSKVWLIASDEFKRNVFKKSFILVLLSVPLLLAFNIGLGLLVSHLEKNDAPLGYIDYSGLLTDPLPAPIEETEKAVQMIPFNSEEGAQSALQAKEIQAFYILSADYLETRKVELVYLKNPGSNAVGQFYDFLQINLLADKTDIVAQRVTEGIDVTIRSPAGDFAMPAGGPTLGHFLPVITSIAFVFLLMMSSGYLMAGVVEEKENRTMEVLVTSVSPLQMVVGKVLGIVSISFTQVIAWVLVGVVTVLIGGQVLGYEVFLDLTIPWDSLLKVVAIAIPTYILAAGVMFTIGATVTEAQEGQSVGALFFILHILPVYLIMILIESPNSPVSIALTLLPFTSLMATGLRSMFSALPLWQVALSVVIQTLCAVITLWLASRVFRMGMLRYGKRIRLAEILGRMRKAPAEGSLT
jgi:ABC-2 type transport system permease protein